MQHLKQSSQQQVVYPVHRQSVIKDASSVQMLVSILYAPVRHLGSGSDDYDWLHTRAVAHQCGTPANDLKQDQWRGGWAVIKHTSVQGGCHYWHMKCIAVQGDTYLMYHAVLKGCPTAISVSAPPGRLRAFCNPLLAVPMAVSKGAIDMAPTICRHIRHM